MLWALRVYDTICCKEKDGYRKSNRLKYIIIIQLIRISYFLS